ncbi:hypothetical protein LB503_003707 [Fusarium chuoi]|nr:hypothetical protein LB503_003707 [Fusarium chuoi]
MSFFGFDTTRHNTAAPGFSQSHDPFAGLSGRDGDDDALDFEETYDGLGDQLEETGDAFNDDTFGDISRSAGKDFDFFGQTAKVADAIDEEHLRYNRQGPAAKPAASAQAHSSANQYTSADYQSYYSNQPYQQQSYQQPVRSGYEKYPSITCSCSCSCSSACPACAQSQSHELGRGRGRHAIAAQAANASATCRRSFLSAAASRIYCSSATASSGPWSRPSGDYSAETPKHSVEAHAASPGSSGDSRSASAAAPCQPDPDSAES